MSNGLSTAAEACAVCGGGDHSLYLPRVYSLGEERYDLWRCGSCGLVFVHPKPGLETIRAFYTERYFHSDFSCGVRQGTYLETEASRVEEYRETLSQIKAFKTSGRFLEVGCAAGSFLNYARRAGFEVEGVDISEWASGTAREQFGLDVHTGRLIEAKLPEQSYDVIFLGDVLEHEPDPSDLLVEVRRLLRDNGVVVIKVPVYVNSFYYRLARRLPWSWTMGRLDERLLQSLKLSDDQPGLPPYHLYEYSPRTLDMLLAKNGLRILRTQSSLLIPEYLKDADAGWPGRVALAGFILLRSIVRTINIHGGHITVFGTRAGTGPEGP